MSLEQRKDGYAEYARFGEEPGDGIEARRTVDPAERPS
jgi:hypothetical protein